MCWAVCPVTMLPAGSGQWWGAVLQPVPLSGTDTVGMKSLSPAEAASPALLLLNTSSCNDFPMCLTLLIEDKIAHLLIPEATFSLQVWAF